MGLEVLDKEKKEGETEIETEEEGGRGGGRKMEQNHMAQRSSRGSHSWGIKECRGSSAQSRRVAHKAYN